MPVLFTAYTQATYARMLHTQWSKVLSVTDSSQGFFFFFYCAVPENIHTHPMEGQWKFQGGGGFQKPNF